MARVRACRGTRRRSPPQGPPRQGNLEESRQALGAPRGGQRGGRRAVGSCHRTQGPSRVGRPRRVEAAKDGPIVHGHSPSRQATPWTCGKRRGGIDRPGSVDRRPKDPNGRREAGDDRVEATGGERLKAPNDGGRETPNGRRETPNGRRETPYGDSREAANDDGAEGNARRLQALDQPDPQAATHDRDVARRRGSRDRADRTHGLTPTADR
jgi:hypothetical protein